MRHVSIIRIQITIHRKDQDILKHLYEINDEKIFT